MCFLVNLSVSQKVGIGCWITIFLEDKDTLKVQMQHELPDDNEKHLGLQNYSRWQNKLKATLLWKVLEMAPVQSF